MLITMKKGTRPDFFGVVTLTGLTARFTASLALRFVVEPTFRFINLAPSAKMRERVWLKVNYKHAFQKLISVNTDFIWSPWSCLLCDLNWLLNR